MEGLCRQTDHCVSGDEALLKVLHALSDPIRLKIVAQLAKEGEVACKSFGFDMPKSSLAHHFSVLREAGIITARREGRDWVKSIRKDELQRLYPGLLDAVISAMHRS